MPCIPKDEKARAAALAKMEQVADSFKKEEESFSDVYSTFQEERHTAMSPEERDRFARCISSRRRTSCPVA